MSDLKTNFPDFIAQAIALKEIALVLAQDESEEEALRKMLIEADFVEAPSVSALLEKMKTNGNFFLTLDSSVGLESLKQLYDFTAQYATGQIEIFDPVSFKTQVIAPNYGKTHVIILANVADLKLIAQKGFNFLNNCGLTYNAN